MEHLQTASNVFPLLTMTGWTEGRCLRLLAGTHQSRRKKITNQRSLPLLLQNTIVYIIIIYNFTCLLIIIIIANQSFKNQVIRSFSLVSRSSNRRMTVFCRIRDDHFSGERVRASLQDSDRHNLPLELREVPEGRRERY